MPDKIKALIQNVILFLETGERGIEIIQEKFDEMTLAINDLQEELSKINCSVLAANFWKVIKSSSVLT